MGDVFCLNHPETVRAGFNPLVGLQYLWRPIGKVPDACPRANKAADSFGMRRNSEPIVQRAAFVGFEMAETDAAKGRAIQDGIDTCSDFGKQTAQISVIQQRFIVPDQKR